ncbi:hypothetical protein GGS23DRAFT_567075 [Durotheca rogersii]|uniref:uncharacterized protein n=1 Tax=Durotheca rogersii TaxID=419775 RepID=UPI0022200BC3|nr:uncharacterized protein GGS23DRAFT_567075 [Durotheca rogersii]KAI5863446.1 hypothetical protein GGS23DRAFT_567075 [Durotheca rogersii]
MARERKKAPGPPRAVQAVLRRAKMERAQHYQDHIWRSLNPLKQPPKLKYKTYFESVENTDKKKKLEFKITTDRLPPPGFEFVPLGHPRLSYMCKELSRDEEAMIFIVSDSKNPDNLDHHMNRVGYHFRQTIVDKARLNLKRVGKFDRINHISRPGEPEPIPKDQKEINDQADAVLRDLFPRIPHTDRREIISHAFRKDGNKASVGMAQELTLARRVQLAALAHIRHTHTRYDELLKESDWANARKAVEKPCLDIIVKWRGDEETGRDQLDEILREVIEISDSEDETEDETPSADNAPAQPSRTVSTTAVSAYQADPQGVLSVDKQPVSRVHGRDTSIPGLRVSPQHKIITRSERKAARKTQRFRRYAAAAEALAGTSGYHDHTNGSSAAPFGSIPMDLTRSPGTVYTISSREPTAVVQDSPRLEQIPARLEAQANLHPFDGAPRTGGTTPMFLDNPEANLYAPTHSAHDPDGYRSKVGHPPPRFDHPHAPVLSGRGGFQDLLVPSIEPASPIEFRDPHDTPRASHRVPRQFEETHRAISRGFYESGSAISDSRSPRGMLSGNEVVARRRVAPHPRELESRVGPVYAQAHHFDGGEGPRCESTEYLPEMPTAAPRATDRALFPCRPVSTESMTRYSGDVPHRTRARQIVIDDGVLPVRRYPEDKGYQPHLSRQEDFVRDVSVREDTRMQDAADVVFDNSYSRQRNAPNYYHGSTNHPSHRSVPYPEPDAYIAPAADSQRHTTLIEARTNRRSDHYQDSPYVRPQVHRPTDWPSDASREVRPFYPEPIRSGPRCTSNRHDLREPSSHIPIWASTRDQEETHYAKTDEIDRITRPHMAQQPDNQLLHLRYPSHNHYIGEDNFPIRGDVPGRHDAVYFDRRPLIDY